MNDQFGSALIERSAGEIRAQGYSIIEDFLSAEQVDALRRVIERLSGRFSGRNNFEGTHTERIYSLLAYDQLAADLVEDARVMSLCEQFLEPNFLLTTSQSICIHPGENPQPWHGDDSFYAIPRPRPPVGLTTIIALDEFTAENGATQILPGSHLWSEQEIGGDYHDGEEESDPNFAERMAEKAKTALMPAGACLVLSSNTLHRGGANRSPAPRLAISNQYCQPWARTIENFYLSIPRERVRDMSPRVQSLLGYSVHPPFIGQVAGSHPVKVLEPDYLTPLERYGGVGK